MEILLSRVQGMSVNSAEYIVWWIDSRKNKVSINSYMHPWSWTPSKRSFFSWELSWEKVLMPKKASKERVVVG